MTVHIHTAAKREVACVPTHGSRHGGNGAFDGRAKRSGNGSFVTVSTGKELFDALKSSSKSGEDKCHCIKNLAIHSHAYGTSISMRWDSGFGITKPSTISSMDWGETERTKAKQGEARDISDLSTAISSKEIVFCKPCTIKLFGCWTGKSGGLAEALSSATSCNVIAPVGKCYPVDSSGQRVDKNNRKTEVGGHSSAWNSWRSGTPTPYSGPLSY